MEHEHSSALVPLQGPLHPVVVLHGGVRMEFHLDISGGSCVALVSGISKNLISDVVVNRSSVAVAKVDNFFVRYI